MYYERTNKRGSGMSDTIYCLSNPDEPGLVRIAARANDELHHSGIVERDICGNGERIDWSLKVSHAGMAMKAFHRSLRRYRKNRGKGIYRCSPMDARAVAIRYTTLRPNAWNTPSPKVNDGALATMLIVAFLLSVFFTQAAQLGTAPTLGITATVLAGLTIGVAILRGERAR